MSDDYLALKNLSVYVAAREYGILSWRIYHRLDWQLKKIIGDQFIRSVDSVGANIAEGYGRFHYLDKNRFYYNARGSLLESRHWLCLLLEREIIKQQEFDDLVVLFSSIYRMLNALIKSQYDKKSNS